MTSLQKRLEQTSDFLIGAELVSNRGTIAGGRASRTLAYARDLGVAPRVDWISITDNAGGNPKLAPAALGGPILNAGREVVIHLSCKDVDRNGLESAAWQLASIGFHNLLALSGGSTSAGIAGGAKPVFDIDSAGLLWLLGQMNAGLDVKRFGARPAGRLAATCFHSGCVVTNFNLRETEVMPRLLKLEKKIAVGARWVVNQIGCDSRKASDLIVWGRRRDLGHVPLTGNVYVLNPAVTQVFRRQTIPGVVVSDELAALCEKRGREADHGKAFFLELAAKQVAVYRGLGYRGAYLGDVHAIKDLGRVLEIESRFAEDDWRQFARDIRYSRPGEFFLHSQDPATGLADPGRLNPDYVSRGMRPRSNASVTFPDRISKLAHAAMLTAGRGLWDLGARLCSRAKDPMQGPALHRAVERARAGRISSSRMLRSFRTRACAALPAGPTLGWGATTSRRKQPHECAAKNPPHRRTHQQRLR